MHNGSSKLGLQPKWSNKDQSTETAALHECFGDLTCLFIFLTDREVVEYLLKHTSGNLHASNCLASLSDDFGLYGTNISLTSFDANLLKLRFY